MLTDVIRITYSPCAESFSCFGIWCTDYSHCLFKRFETMPTKGRKFITEFLIPSLNTEKFGSKLMWLDGEHQIFQMQWNHKSASDWKTSDAAVFAAWDKKKGHYKPDDKEYYTKSKQRFRAALYKFIRGGHITELCSTDKYTKIYCLGNGENVSNSYIFRVKSKTTEENSVSNSGKLVNSYSFFCDDVIDEDQVDDTLNSINYIKEDHVNDEEQIQNTAEDYASNTLYYLKNLDFNNPGSSFSIIYEKKLPLKDISSSKMDMDNINSLYDDPYVKPEKIFKNENYVKYTEIPMDTLHDDSSTTLIEEQENCVHEFCVW
ncbi:IRF tryptophan pentad repeat domain-containing protein [Caerostris darwini]|uniref:IRF tryptophan pentad repeat domain-containing protein n=1 Tax=Caerostris darwini TaxID=1538125 RepID=A0AAV4PC95_9ARAC|nr:IRF tryptophan pentad repeat domain-containing protein [Caerostris darwini]